MRAPLALPLALALACAAGQCLGFNLDAKFPLVFWNPERNDSTLFGMSVLLQTDSRRNLPPWIQIGAPKGKRGTKNSGKVFRCQIGSRCTEIAFDHFEYGDDSNDGDFVGSAMASQSSDSAGTVVVCGARWRERRANFGTHLHKGICNWMNVAHPNAQPSQWLAPLANDDSRSLKKGNTQVYDWALGQAGFSAHFPRADSATVVLGAPGVYNWRGTLLYCPTVSEFRGPLARSSFSAPQGSLDGPTCAVAEPTNSEFDYLGYQVTSGRFFSPMEILLAASAPRGGSKLDPMRGMVFLYRVPLLDGAPLKPVTSVQGTQLGGYFGSSLAVGDVNGDGFDDLAVGAPLAVTGATGLSDDGHVHLFLGGDPARSLVRPTTANEGKLSGSASGGRFGHSLTCHDIDRDGFHDLVVGAPFEDEGRGVVYVFSGGPLGLAATPTQRLAACALQLPTLRGFGFALAPLADIDDNRFADLAVGALGAAVVLRAHPVVTLATSLTTAQPRVPQNATRATVSACVTFAGRDAPAVVNVVRTLNVSSDHDLVQLIDGAGQRLRAIVSNLRLTKASPCEDFDIDIKTGSKYLDGIVVQLSARLDTKLLDVTPGQAVDGESMNGNKFRQNLPMSRRAADPATLRVEFENDCHNQTCIADLRLRCRFLSGDKETHTHVVGSRRALHLSVSATNEGEPAYATQLSVAVPPPVALVNVPPACELDVLNARLHCDLRDLTPLRNSSSVQLGLDMSAVVDTSAPLEFVVVATTRSKQAVEDNRQAITLAVVRDAKLAIYGKAVGRTSYRYDGANASSQHVDFAHEFTVDKLGESPIDSAVLRVRYVTGWQPDDVIEPVTLLVAHQPEVLQDGQPLSCESSEAFVNETSSSEGLDSDVRAKRQAPSAEGTSVRPGEQAFTEQAVIEQTFTELTDQASANQTLFVDCATRGAVCGLLSCTARPFREQSELRMTLRIRLDASKLAGLLGRKSIASLSTWADVTWLVDGDGRQANANANASTLFIGVAEADKVESWIIALSIGAGLLVFTFVVMGLVKAGFFQRKTKMEMETLIEQDAEIEATQRQSMMYQGGSDVEDD